MIEVDWKDLPTNKKLIVNFEGNETLTLEIDEDYELVYIYIGTDDYYCTDLIKIKNKIKSWSILEEIEMVKETKVMLEFSESELEELDDFLFIARNFIVHNELLNWQEKEEKIKKFRDKFSKVEF